MSENVAGFSCALCRITAEVDGSMCSSAWQQGQVTVIRADFAIPTYSNQSILTNLAQESPARFSRTILPHDSSARFFCTRSTLFGTRRTNMFAEFKKFIMRG